MMKTNTVETIIEDFRSGQNIFRRPSVELLVREISRLQKENEKLKVRLAASENDILLREVNEMLKKTQSRVQELDSVNQDMGLTISKMDYAYTIDKEMMEKRIAELEAEQRWIDVSMTSQEPEIGQRILTIDMDDNIEVEEYFGQFYNLITYWKPVYRPNGYVKYDDFIQPPKDESCSG